MTLSRADQMVERLRQMQVASPDIEASAVVSVDGLIIASALPNEVEEVVYLPCRLRCSAWVSVSLPSLVAAA